MKHNRQIHRYINLFAMAAFLLPYSCKHESKEDNTDASQMVDLGLSVKWGRCNLGASEPQKGGNYYAWGEVEPKSEYNWSTYRWGYLDNSYKVSKYCCDDSQGYLDNKTQLETGAHGDDVASYKLGGKWRMPTPVEWRELMTQCAWKWTSIGGVEGFKVIGKTTGFTDNWIFLPAAGGMENKNAYGGNWVGLYWSSFVDEDNASNAWSFRMFEKSVGVESNVRTLGYRVRPVSE